MTSMILPPDLLRKLKDESETDKDDEKEEDSEYKTIAKDDMTIELPEATRGDLKNWEIPNSWEDIEIDSEDKPIEDEERIAEELPVLVINYTKLKTLEIDMKNIDFKLHSLISMRCEEICEELFSESIAFHTTNIKSKGLKSQLESSSDDEYVVLEYPDYINEMELSTLWREINNETKWKSVNYILSLLSECNHDLIWKKKMSEDIRNIGVYEGKELLKRVSDDIEKLKRYKEDRAFLRDEINYLKFVKENLNKEEIKKVEKEEEEIELPTIESMTEELDKIEKEIKTIVDRKMNYSEDELDNNPIILPPTNMEEMCVIDQILAIIFERYPHYSWISDKNYEISLLSQHVEVRKLWLLDFGCFPKIM